MTVKLAGVVTRHARWTIVCIAAVTLTAAVGLVDPRSGEMLLGIDPSFDRLMSREDDARAFHEAIERRFAGDEIWTIALLADDIFTTEILERVARMTARLEEVPGVRRVVSLTTAVDVRGGDEGLVIAPFLSGVRHDQEHLGEMRRRVQNNPVYSRNLVSQDGRATAVVVELDDTLPEALDRDEIDRRIGVIADEERGPAEVRISGSPRIQTEISRTLLADLVRIVPIAFLVASAIALISFRSLRGVLVPTSTIAIALVWTLGAIAWSGHSLDLVSTTLPPLVLTIGFAYAVHVLAAYQEVARRRAFAASSELAGEALREVAGPVLMTAVTTTVGFLALATSPLPSIQAFGVLAAFGAVATLLASLSYAPAVLALLPRPRGATVAAGPRYGDRALEKLAQFDLTNRRGIFVASAIVAVISTWGLLRVEVRNDLIGNFSVDSPVRRDFDAISASLGGATPFYVVLEAEAPGAFRSPENLRQVEQLQAWLEEQPAVGRVTSLVDVVDLIARGFVTEAPAREGGRVPDSAELVDQMLFLAANEDLESFADMRFRTTRLLVRARTTDTAVLRELFGAIEGRIAMLTGGIRGGISGDVVRVTRAVDDIANGQMASLGIAFAAIFAILVVVFRSVRMAAIALVPNALPLLVYLGAMGLLGISLDAITGLVGCMALGVAADDTMHLMTRFATCAKERSDPSHAVVAALCSVGRPLTCTSVALFLGFLTLTLSQLQSHVHLGVLSALTLFAAWALNLTLTPALCAGLRGGKPTGGPALVDELEREGLVPFPMPQSRAAPVRAARFARPRAARAGSIPESRS
jgi:hydrophobe/amphiphile efflux-3 (HAE3) family protein